MTRGKWTIAIATLVLAFSLPGLCGSAEMAKGLLDGKTFVGETGEKGKDKGDKESFVFQDGTFDPLQCHPWGFGASPYTARQEGEAVRFESVTTSEKEGSMKWTGTVQGERMEGTMVWTKAGQAPIEYWFRAMVPE